MRMTHNDEEQFKSTNELVVCILWRESEGWLLDKIFHHGVVENGHILFSSRSLGRRFCASRVLSLDCLRFRFRCCCATRFLSMMPFGKAINAHACFFVVLESIVSSFVFSFLVKRKVKRLS